MTVPEPDDYDNPDLTSATADTLRTVANVLGVLAGVLFFTAFGIGLAQRGDVNLMYLSFGVLFLLFPLLVRRRARSGP